MEGIKINHYNNVKSPYVKGSYDIEDWLEMVRESKYSDTIEMARCGDLDPESTKTKLPCVTYNFFFEGYKKDSNIKNSTGLLYLDIDSPNFNPNAVDGAHVYSMYKSFGGEGYCVLVKVEGLTKENFHSTFNAVTEEMGISEFCDSHAKKASQFTVISYDPDIFINPSSKIFPSNTSSVSNIDSNINNIYYKKKEKKGLSMDVTFFDSNFRFSNLEEIIDKIDFKGKRYRDLGEDPIYFAEVFIPKHIASGKRNHVMFNVLTQLYGLNPNTSEAYLWTCADTINQKYMDHPLPEREVWEISRKVFSNGPRLKYNKKRRIIFNPAFNLTRGEKRVIVAVNSNKRRGAVNTREVDNCINSWNTEEKGKITMKKIAEETGLSTRTIKRRSSQIKEKMKNINKSLVN